MSKPHVLGITRELERSGKRDWAGRWVGALFDYHGPILALNRGEQRLLTYALPGATDEELACLLGTSLSNVKKLWVSVHRRVEDRLPELAGNQLRLKIPAVRRGPEKRRRLLSYLREHPEELRPYSRKLLMKTASG